MASRKRSRRVFIKAATLGTVTVMLPAAPPTVGHAQSVPLPSEKLADANADERVLVALGIAKTDPLIPEAFSKFGVSDLAFDIARDYLVLSATQENQVGLVLRHAKTATPRLGGNLILTCDLDAKQVMMVQFLVGVGQIHAFDLQSIVLDARTPLTEIPVDPRCRGENYEPRYTRLHMPYFWSFAHADYAPLDPREATSIGWPPELPDIPRWHVIGCQLADWLIRPGSKDGPSVFLAMQVGEALAGKMEASRTVALVYDMKPAIESTELPKKIE